MNKQEEAALAVEWKKREKGLFEDLRKVNPPIQSVRYTQNRYDREDNAFRSGATFGLGEIKIRRQDNIFFTYNPPFIEHQKYVALLEVKSQILLSSGTNCDLFYFNFTRDRYCLVYHLCEDRTQYTWVERWLPKDDFNPYNKEWKHVHELRNPMQVFKLI